MGANLPSTRLGKIEWFETRTPVWTNDPTGIGLSVEQVAEITGRTLQARNAYAAVLNARAAATVATQEFYDAVASMHAYGSDCIALVKAFADASDDPATVYAAAMVSPPAIPGTLPPPPQPYDLTTRLLNDGTIELKWKSAGGGGTRYSIYRRLGAAGAFTVVGDVGGAKTFIDGGVPAGTPSATYYVVAKRSELSSPPSEWMTMPFGAGNDGEESGLSLAA